MTLQRHAKQEYTYSLVITIFVIAIALLKNQTYTGICWYCTVKYHSTLQGSLSVVEFAISVNFLPTLLTQRQATTSTSRKYVLSPHKNCNKETISY